MTDIVDRLRSLYVQHGTNYVQEAADVIEAMRTDNATLRAALYTQAEGAAKLMAQRDELLALLREAKSIITELYIVYGCPEPRAAIDRFSDAIANETINMRKTDTN